MKSIFYIAAFLFLLPACNQVDPQLQNQLTALQEKLQMTEKALETAQKDETAFVHTVFFWMKAGTTEEQKADFVKNGLGKLAEIQSIYRFYAGPPAMTPREVVDNSYDFALVCHFKNTADQDLYQDDPIHLQFIEDYKALWERVVVYDNLLDGRLAK